MTIYDIKVEGFVADAYRASQRAPIVRINGYTYVFYLGPDGSYWTSSDNDGLTWSGSSQIQSGGSFLLAIWPEWETPGDSGSLVHIAVVETGTDDVVYYNLNTSTDTLSSPVTVVNLTSTGANANATLTITKARGGNLYIGYDIDGGTETGFYRSTDGGASWGVRTDLNEAANTDYYILAPGFAADNQDIMAIYWDRSASEISRKIYDDSANTWAESSISGSMTSIAHTTCSPQFSVLVDGANSRLVLIAWTNRDTAGADLKCWWVTESAITAKTDVITDSSDDQQMCSLSLNVDNGDLIAYYGGKSDGTETAGTSIRIYYKTSTDDGATWGSETQLSATSRNFDFLAAPGETDGIVVVYRHTGAGTSDNLLTPYDLQAGGGGLATSLLNGSVIH